MALENFVLNIFLALIPGLVLFLFGLIHLSKEIEELASDKLKNVLARFTQNRWKAALFGASTTAIIQSSTATTLIALALVNAGTLTFQQSLGIIIGANIGTTVTSQLIAFNLFHFAPWLMGIGFVLTIIGKRYRLIGKIILFFGLIFFGLDLAKGALMQPELSEFLKMLFIQFQHPVILFGGGALVTALTQSSAIATGLLVLMGLQGLVPLSSAIPIIFGINLGTTFTGLIASIGMQKSARRTALAHFTFNLVGAALFIPFVPLFQKLVASTSPIIANQIANAHLLFNVFTAVLFLLLLPFFAAFIEKMIPGIANRLQSKVINQKPTRANFLPAMIDDCLEQLRLLRFMLAELTHCLHGKKDSLSELEKQSDFMMAELSQFAYQSIRKNPSKQQIIFELNKASFLIEQTADTLLNLGGSIDRVYQRGGKFSDAQKKEIHALIHHFDKILQSASSGKRVNWNPVQKYLNKVEKKFLIMRNPKLNPAPVAFQEIVFLFNGALTNLMAINKILKKNALLLPR